jgi:hypothetical protein
VIFTSFYTDNGRYPELAARLRKSLEAFGLPYTIGRGDDQGEWNKTCCIKPQVILNTLISRRRPVVWLDCDTQIVSFPHLLFQPHYDFACYNWYADANNVANLPYDPQRLACSGGVMMFGYTAAAIELLLRWQHRIDKGGLLDDPSLDDVFNTNRPPVNPLWLPREYNRMDSLFPETKPVIDHEYARGKHRDTKETA